MATEPTIPPEPRRGRLLVGTSGFAYPGWVPRFYPADLRADSYLAHYAGRLDAVELNNTYYQQPRPAKVDAWLAATPTTFRFAAKAQRGSAFRLFGDDPVASVAWLTEPYRRFGDRLGAILMLVQGRRITEPGRLTTALAAWPRDIPLAIEFTDQAWHVDETFDTLSAAGVALCANDRPDEPDPPTIRRTGPFLYLRLRRLDYTDDELRTWARRLDPFLAAGDDAYVFFRHDDVGRGAELASGLSAAAAELG